MKPACWLVLFVPLVGSIGLAASEPRPGGLPVIMTLDVEWLPPASSPRSVLAIPSTDVAPGSKLGVDLAVTSGRIVEAVAWPVSSRELGQTPVAPRNQIDASWLIGSTGRGKVRVRIEAPLVADLVIRVGEQVARIGLASLLEGPQKGATAGPQPTEVVVERLSWDAVQVNLGTTDGTAESGSAVPLGIGFNILTPEAAEVTSRGVVELRPIAGGEPVWRQEWREIVPTNTLSPPQHALSLTVPVLEGTYLLEVRTDWEPLGDLAGTKLGRWVRRRRNPAQITSATRRLTLAVVNSRTPAPVPLTKADGSGIDVDVIDLTRPTGHRASASGRATSEVANRWAWTVPDAALVAPVLRDRLRGWIGRSGGELATLPAPDGSGLAWSAVSLRVLHPDRPHRLTLTVTGGHPAAVGVALIATGNGVCGSEPGRARCLRGGNSDPRRISAREFLLAGLARRRSSRRRARQPGDVGSSSGWRNHLDRTGRLAAHARCWPRRGSLARPPSGQPTRTRPLRRGRSNRPG